MGLRFNPFTGTFDFTGGSAGPAGHDGATWFTDAGVPDTSLGSAGDFYVDSDNGNYYLKTDATTWVLQGSLKGPAGNTGGNIDGGGPDSNFGGIDPTDGGGP